MSVLFKEELTVVSKTQYQHYGQHCFLVSCFGKHAKHTQDTRRKYSKATCTKQATFREAQLSPAPLWAPLYSFTFLRAALCQYLFLFTFFIFKIREYISYHYVGNVHFMSTVGKCKL